VRKCLRRQPYRQARGEHAVRGIRIVNAAEAVRIITASETVHEVCDTLYCAWTYAMPHESEALVCTCICANWLDGLRRLALPSRPEQCTPARKLQY
jgi:hypothetical protein